MSESDEAAATGPAAQRTTGPGRLGERDRALLDFERRWFRLPGAKEQAIRDEFGISATRYYQLLAELIDRPEAMAYAPAVVGRLQRLRAARRRERAARRMDRDD